MVFIDSDAFFVNASWKPDFSTTFPGVHVGAILTPDPPEPWWQSRANTGLLAVLRSANGVAFLDAWWREIELNSLPFWAGWLGCLSSVSSFSAHSECVLAISIGVLVEHRQAFLVTLLPFSSSRMPPQNPLTLEFSDASVMLTLRWATSATRLLPLPLSCALQLLGFNKTAAAACPTTTREHPCYYGGEYDDQGALGRMVKDKTPRHLFKILPKTTTSAEPNVRVPIRESKLMSCLFVCVCLHHTNLQIHEQSVFII